LRKRLPGPTQCNLQTVSSTLQHPESPEPGRPLHDHPLTTRVAPQVQYPHDTAPVDRGRATEALREVGLGYLAARGLVEEDDWGQRLSRGEAQRIALARVLYHRPVVRRGATGPWKLRGTDQCSKS
jgi:ABC-type dipeptide/oligopeptide/nickel transport system ATPase subunit